MRSVFLLVLSTVVTVSSASAQILLQRKANFDGEPPTAILLVTALVALPFVLRKRRSQEL